LTETGVGNEMKGTGEGSGHKPAAHKRIAGMTVVGMLAPWLALPVMLIVSAPLALLGTDVGDSTPAVTSVTISRMIVVGVGLALGVVATLMASALTTRWRLLILASYLPLIGLAALIVES